MLLINNTNTNAYFNLAMEEYFLKILMKIYFCYGKMKTQL